MPVPALAIDYAHQLAIAKQLEAFAQQMCSGTLTSKNEFTQRDYIFFGLVDKNIGTFHSIRVLVEAGLADDGFALIRVLAESTVNAAFVEFSDTDQVAKDYADFPDFFRWIEYSDLARVAPDSAKDVTAEEITEMQRAHDAVKDRYAKHRHDWSDLKLIQRAAEIDAKVDPKWNLLRVIVNSAWRKASAYVHGTARSITSRVKEKDGGIVIHREVSPQEQAAALYAANLILFALMMFVDLRLGKPNVMKLKELRLRWANG